MPKYIVLMKHTVEADSYEAVEAKLTSQKKRALVVFGEECNPVVEKLADGRVSVTYGFGETYDETSTGATAGQ